MTVSPSTSKIQHNCNGSLTQFFFTFCVDASSEIQVILTTIASGVETVLIEITDYVVTSSFPLGGGLYDFSSGGTVTTVKEGTPYAYAEGYKLTILRNVPLTQESDFTEGMPTLYETFEDALDKGIRIDQQQNEQLARTIKLKASAVFLGNIEFPSPGAGQYLKWNSAGTALATDIGTTGYSNAWYDARNYGSLEAADAAAYAAGVLLVIPQNYTLTANTTLTASIMRVPGGSFTKAATYTLAINGRFVNPDNGQAFIGFSAGNVTFGAGSVKEVYPEWWATNTLEAANAAAYAAGVLLVIQQNYTLTANTILTAAMKVIPGGSFTAASTYTLAFNGITELIDGCLIGFASGKVTFGTDAVKKVNPELWGKNTTPNTTDMTLEIQCAVATGRPVILLDTTYYVTDKITVATTGQSIKGKGKGKTVISIKTDFNLSAYGVFSFTGGEPGPILEDFQIAFVQPDTAVRANLTQYPPAIHAVGQPRFELRNMKIVRAWKGINMSGNSGGARIFNLDMSAFDYGIFIDGSLDSVRISGLHFWPFDLTANQTQIFYETDTRGLLSARCDDLHLIDSLFINGNQVYLYESASGSTFGHFTNVDFDGRGGITMLAGSIAVSDSWFSAGVAGARSILQVGGDLKVSNSHFFLAATLTNPAVQLGGTGNATLILSNNVFESAAFEAISINAMDSGNKIIVANNVFKRNMNIAYTQPTIYIQSGARATITSNRTTDKGTGAGVFIRIDVDDHHRVALNAPVGWTLTFPAAVFGIYTLN